MKKFNWIQKVKSFMIKTGLSILLVLTNGLTYGHGTYSEEFKKIWRD